MKIFSANSKIASDSPIGKVKFAVLMGHMDEGEAYEALLNLGKDQETAHKLSKDWAKEALQSGCDTTKVAASLERLGFKKDEVSTIVSEVKKHGSVNSGKKVAMVDVIFDYALRDFKKGEYEHDYLTEFKDKIEEVDYDWSKVWDILGDEKVFKVVDDYSEKFGWEQGA